VERLRLLSWPLNVRKKGVQKGTLSKGCSKGKLGGGSNDDVIINCIEGVMGMKMKIINKTKDGPQMKLDHLYSMLCNTESVSPWLEGHSGVKSLGLPSLEAMRPFIERHVDLLKIKSAKGPWHKQLVTFTG